MYSIDLNIVKFMHMNAMSSTYNYRLIHMFPDVNKYFIQMCCNFITNIIGKVKIEQNIETQLIPQNNNSLNESLQWSPKSIGFVASTNDFELILNHLFEILINRYNKRVQTLNKFRRNKIVQE